MHLAAIVKFYIMSQSEDVEIDLLVDYISSFDAGDTILDIVREVKDENGEIYVELYDSGMCYFNDSSADYNMYFVVSSEDIKDGDLLLYITNDAGDGTFYTTEIPITKASDSSTEQTKQTSENTRSSGSGCEVGFLSGMLSLGIALIIAKRKM